MEAASRGSDLINGVVIKEEKRVESSDDDHNHQNTNKIGHRQEDASSTPKSTDLGTTKQMPTTSATRRSPVVSSNKESSPTHKDQEEDQLESAKAQMGEVREENERLKTVLARIMKEYQSLQMHFFDIVQQDQQQSANKKIRTTASTVPATSTTQQEMEDPELISLSLGRSSSSSDPQHHQAKLKDSNYDYNHEQKISSSIISKSKMQDHHQEDQFKQGLALGLDCKVDVVASKPVPGAGSTNVPISPENSFELEHKDQKEVGELWPPSKMLKVMKSSTAGDDEVSQQTSVKKARVSVRARCDTPTMNDGCQWRKYGQKIAKGNPCPRAYYRCTVAPACPVRKQVQRCQEDMSILITTYEGTHNHPLPISATAMASTTSAAACMLMSGSTSSARPGVMPSGNTTTTSAADLHGLNFSLSDNNNSRQRLFYLPNTSISSSPSHPTITLDLAVPPSSSSSSSTSQFNRLSSSNFPANSRYSTTSFNFASSESNSNTLPISWANGYLSYGTHQPYNNKNQMGALNLERQVPNQEHFYQPLLQKTTSPSQQTLTETIAAATKAITSDPSFRSALASAITSIVNGGDGGAHANQAVVENIIQNMKSGDHQFPTTTYTPSTNANGCGSSYLNRSSSSNTQQPGSFLFLSPSLQPFTSSNNASASPVDNRNHIN